MTTINPKEARQGLLSLVNMHPMSAMAEFEQILLSNSGEDAFDSAIKLLSAKLIAEYGTAIDSESKFRVHDSPESTHSAIQELYLAAVQRWPQLESGNSELGISPPHLVRSIRPLMGWQLRRSDLSWLDATLERLVSRDSKGAMGQYFTPREVIRLCVEVLNPRSNEVVMDPACGSGGFLFEAVTHAQKISGSAPQCLGIDFSAKSARVAALLAAASDDSTITISKANSLDGRGYVSSTPFEWQNFLLQDRASATKRASTWGAWNKLGCDVLLTNPPFAGDMDEFELLEAYESQNDQSGRKAVSREHLFLERAVDLLIPGGRLAIVVPQGILANTSANYLRSWLLRKCRVLAVVGLHPHAFLPYTGVKTAILFLQKPKTGEVIPSEYPILFVVSRSAGKDSSGRVSGTSDYGLIEATLKNFFFKQEFEWAKSTVSDEATTTDAEIVNSVEILQSLRLDAEYYDPFARRLQRKLLSESAFKIGDVVHSNVSRFKRKNFREISYLDISSVDGRTGLTFPETIDADDAPSRASYLVEPGDVLVSTVRPDRNVVAIVTAGHEAPPVASNGFCVLRSKDLPPELLFAYCKSEAFKRILTMHATASMYPTVCDKDVASVPFVRPDANTESEIVDLVRSGLLMIEQAQKNIQEAIDKVNAAISG